MLHRKGLVRAAAMAALACAGIAHADSSDAADNGLSLQPAYLQAAAPAPASAPTPPATPAKPLMGTLEATPIGKALDSANITVSGYFEGGYSISFQHPPGNVIAGRVYDTKNERVVLDQADLAFDRTIDYSKGKFDIGFHFEANYGWDSGLNHSDGLYDTPAQRANGVGGYYTSRTSPDNQFDILQAYADFAIPVGTGLRIRAGKIVTLLGYEVISPVQSSTSPLQGNPFYSHSYLFGYAIPLTNTGIIGEYKFNDDLKIDGGVTRGENQSLRDNNGSPDVMGQITWTPQATAESKKWSVILNYEIGPEAAHDNHDYWTVIDLIAQYNASDKLAFVVNADYGDAPHALGIKSAQWGGVAGYAGYMINSIYTLNGRVEWYNDADGFTLGAPGNLNVYEATVGLQIHPFPDDALGSNLVIRPEVRADYADKDFFNAGTKHFQATFGIDATFAF
ncbi:MAG TPA: outer membrane beta-barrel protein [Tepidisphaeraceae bacterium]|jgi:hypothetical protein|nr:outer membrane beta-barrel protein [Tepidisphaeraceae bacterium]